MNDFILPSESSVRFKLLDEAVKLTENLVRGALLAKFDMKSAFGTCLYVGMTGTFSVSPFRTCSLSIYAYLSVFVHLSSLFALFQGHLCPNPCPRWHT